MTENGAAVLDGNYPELGGIRIDYDMETLQRLLDETVIEELATARRACADDRTGVGTLATSQFKIDFCWLEPDMTHPLLSWLEAELDRVSALAG